MVPSIDELFNKYLMNLNDTDRLMVFERQKGALRGFNKALPVGFIKSEYKKATIKDLAETKTKYRLYFINSCRSVTIEVLKELN